MNHHALCTVANRASAKATAVRRTALRRLRTLVPPGRQRERLLVIGATGLVLIASTSTFAGRLAG